MDCWGSEGVRLLGFTKACSLETFCNSVISKTLYSRVRGEILRVIWKTWFCCYQNGTWHRFHRTCQNILRFIYNQVCRSNEHWVHIILVVLSFSVRPNSGLCSCNFSNYISIQKTSMTMTQHITHATSFLRI